MVTVLLMHRSRRRIHFLFSDFQKAEMRVTGYVADLLRGSRDVKLYAMEEKVSADFETRVWEIGQKSYERDIRTHMEWMRESWGMLPPLRMERSEIGWSSRIIPKICRPSGGACR